MRSILTLGFLVFVIQHVFSGTLINDHLYINRGFFTTVDGKTFPYLAFNSSAAFTPSNRVVQINSGDTLRLIVFNNDTIIHQFQVKNQAMTYTILPGDSIVDTLIFNTRGVHVYFDPMNGKVNRYMGLGGMICVHATANEKSYYWNLKEHQKTLNDSIAAGASVNWSQYEPDYFTINGLSNPDLQMDTLSRIVANVGDTLYIFVANTGQSSHSIHFHGFHSKAVFKDAQLIRNGWEKDTWGLFPMDAVVLQMIPDKPGNYSVHDHNLVAVSGGGTHPNGMFTIMEINP